MTNDIEAIKEMNCLFLVALRDQALMDPKVASFIYQVPLDACKALAAISSSQVLELARNLDVLVPSGRQVPQRFWPLICRELSEEKDVDRLAMKLTILLSN